MDHLDVGNANDEKDSSARRPKVKTYFINIYYLSNHNSTTPTFFGFYNFLNYYNSIVVRQMSKSWTYLLVERSQETLPISRLRM